MDGASWVRYVWRCRPILFLFFAAIALVYGQETAVPVGTQWSFLQKILSFQRRVDPADQGRAPVLAILYQSKFRVSLDVRNELAEILEETKPTMGGIALKVVEIDLTRESDPAARLAAGRATIAYVAPLRSFDIGLIVRATRDKKILSFSGVPEYVEKGLAVGIGNRGGKPHILINRNAAIQEGSDFHSQLLKLATIVE